MGRTDGCPDPIAPKVLIVDLFAPEAAVWPGPLGLGAVNVSTPGLSPLSPAVQCNAALDVCQAVTGESEINAASTVTALALSPYLDLRSTYVLVAGIAGVNPECAGLASVGFSRYLVQVGLAYEIDAREIPGNWCAYHSGCGESLHGTSAHESWQVLWIRTLRGLFPG